MRKPSRKIITTTRAAFEYRPSVRSPQNKKPASALAGGITPSYRATLCRLQMFPALSLCQFGMKRLFATARNSGLTRGGLLRGRRA